MINIFKENLIVPQFGNFKCYLCSKIKGYEAVPQTGSRTLL